MLIDKAIQILQKKHLYKLLSKSYFENEDIFKTLNSYLEPYTIPLFKTKMECISDNYDKMTTFLQKKDVIEKCNVFITKLNRYHHVSSKIVSAPITSKKFLIAWLIVACPEFVLEKDADKLIDGIYPDEIYFISRTFVEQLTFLTNYDSHEREIKFKKNMNIYCNAIGYFLNKDKIMYTNKLINEWLEMYETIDLIKNSDKYSSESEKIKCVNEIIKTQKKITTYISIFAPDITETKLIQYAELMRKLLQATITNQKICLVNDIKTKKYAMLTDIITLLKENIIKLAKTYENSVNQYLDQDTIIKTMSDLTEYGINQYGDYLIGIINKLEAPASVKSTNEKWDELKKQSSKFKLEEYMTEMIFFVLDEIQSIKENIINIYTMVSFGLNPFNQVDSGHNSKNCHQMGR